MIESIAGAADSIPSPVTFLAGVLLLLLGGSWLVEGSVRIARRLKISPLIIGLTIVAFGTSAPELAFNLIAALSGNASLSFGNVIGSNIANIGLVLGLTALIRAVPISKHVERVEFPLLMGVTLLAALLALLPLAHAPLPGEESLRFGYGRVEAPILLICFAGFCTMWVRSARRGNPEASSAIELPDTSPRPGLPVAVAMTIGGLLILLVGGKAAEVGAIGLATAAGLSPSFIGLSIVAVATSLPEIVTSIIAARRGQPELAIGNVIGSNLFNLLLVMGVTSLIVPVPVPPMGVFDLLAMLVLTALLLPMTRRGSARAGGHNISRTSGVILITLYLAFMVTRLFIDVPNG